jgi:hypothetical protein
MLACFTAVSAFSVPSSFSSEILFSFNIVTKSCHILMIGPVGCVKMGPWFEVRDWRRR